MKRFSVASLTEIFRKNRLPVAAVSLLMMMAAAFSIVLCEIKITALENKWRLLYELKELWGYTDNEAMTQGQPRGPTRYDIKVNLMRSSNNKVEIQFCDKYSFILSWKRKRPGVYYKTGHSPGKYVSAVRYPRESTSEEEDDERLRDLKLHFKCDLIEKTVLVFMNGKFMEKVYLGPEPLNYSFGLPILRGNKGVILTKLEISDHEGKVLFRTDFVPWFIYKRISQAFLSLGVLIFLVLACSERLFFRRMLLFVIPLFFLEVFLRVAYHDDPNLDIHQLKPKWRFEISTNFYGAFNHPKEITIKSYFPEDSRTYLIANPEHVMRIVCIGASPLRFEVPSVDQAFPAVLEKRLNSLSEKKNVVIPITIPAVEYLNGTEPNIFLKEALSRLDPDLILYYGKLASVKGGYFKKWFGKDFILYRRAEKIIKKNSGWIKNDRLLYAALEFKEPVKEVVYSYDFLCNSYLFMAVENIRKRFLGEWHLEDRGTSTEKPDSFFEEVLELCKAKGIKVVFIPQLEFSICSNHGEAEDFLTNLRKEHPEIYSLSLEGVFNGNKNFLLAGDNSHANAYGHQVIAQEIFRQLTEKGLLDNSKAIE